MLKMLAISYIALVALFYFFSNWEMFHPPSLEKEKSLSDHIFFSSLSGKKIAAIYLYSPAAKYTILFSHGNAEDLFHLFPLLQAFQHRGYSILSYDYEGYGLSEGRPNEKNTYQAIDAAYNYLTNQLKISPDKIVLYGRSLGTGPTIDLASRVPTAGVILESPFLSAYRVMTQIPLFPFDKFENLKKVGKINVPVLVLQGDQDTVIPVWHGKKIFEAITSRKQFFRVTGASHNDILIVAKETYWDTLKKFINQLEPSSLSHENQ